MTTNQQRIIDISKKLKLSHIGSNLSVLPVLEEIYGRKQDNDIVILDNAHAHLSHLVVRAEYETDDHFGETTSRELDVEHLIHTYGIHCDRKAGCDASGGSLGHGLGIAIGYALANRQRDVYVTVSDGSMMEGSNWEALRIIDSLKLDNVKIYTNFNGYTAVDEINAENLVIRMKVFYRNINVRYTDNTKEFDGIEGHYKTIGEVA